MVASALAGATLAPRTVLVVDDDAPLRALCRPALGEAGFRVLEAADGDEAERRATETAESKPIRILLAAVRAKDHYTRQGLPAGRRCQPGSDREVRAGHRARRAP